MSEVEAAAMYRCVSLGRYVGEGEAGDEEAEGSGGQAEGRDPSQGQRAHAEERGHRGSKAALSISRLDVFFSFFFLFRSPSYHLADTVSTASTRIQVAVLKVPHYAGFQFSSEVGQK